MNQSILIEIYEAILRELKQNPKPSRAIRSIYFVSKAAGDQFWSRENHAEAESFLKEWEYDNANSKRYWRTINGLTFGVEFEK